MKSLRFRSYTLYGVKWAVLRMLKEATIAGWWNKNDNPLSKGVVYR